jgi:transcriptional regulator with XRE-family HTH domain
MPDIAIRDAIPRPAEAALGRNAVRAIRETRGYSLEKLSLTCGLATHEIEDIESGKDADPVKLRRIAAALQLPEDALIGMNQ